MLEPPTDDLLHAVKAYCPSAVSRRHTDSGHMVPLEPEPAHKTNGRTPPTPVPGRNPDLRLAGDPPEPKPAVDVQEEDTADEDHATLTDEELSMLLSDDWHRRALTRVILVNAPELDRPLRRDPRVELIRARNAFEALGELGQAERDSADPPAVVLGPDALTQIDPEALRKAIDTVDPHARLIAINRERGAHRSSAATWAEPETLARALFPNDAPSDAEAPSVEIDFEEKPAKKKKKKKHKDKKRAALSAGDERVVLRIILSGGDPLPEIVSRVTDALGSDRIEFVRATDNDNQPNLAEGFAAVRVSRRSHTYGWLVGPDALEPALKDQAETAALWLSLAEQHAQLRALAFTDSLTGAWNRRYFDKYLASALHEARVKRHNLTLLIFDIDDFKHYNDEYGHAAGDEILTEVIRLLKTQVRPNDKVCRIGGDEFAVIFYDPAGPREPASHHPRSIFQIARRFQKQIADHNFPKLGERAKGSLTISGGLATYPWDAYDAQELIERADHLAMVSKKQGKNVLTLGNAAHQADQRPPDHDGIDLPNDTN
ncbi:pleD [Symbiodinium necroappetens]|uniref:PleD protein n=1 Tax=Symbiodinium necroappetens TaxID=1628268 RepID=A0A812JUM6_9DINO|nr:pleD [Symbiodinium necroappetens]